MYITLYLRYKRTIVKEYRNCSYDNSLLAALNCNFRFQDYTVRVCSVTSDGPSHWNRFHSHHNSNTIPTDAANIAKWMVLLNDTSGSPYYLKRTCYCDLAEVCEVTISKQ